MEEIYCYGEVMESRIACIISIDERSQSEKKAEGKIKIGGGHEHRSSSSSSRSS